MPVARSSMHVPTRAHTHAGARAHTQVSGRVYALPVRQNSVVEFRVWGCQFKKKRAYPHTAARGQLRPRRRRRATSALFATAIAAPALSCRELLQTFLFRVRGLGSGCRFRVLGMYACTCTHVHVLLQLAARLACGTPGLGSTHAQTPLFQYDTVRLLTLLLRSDGQHVVLIPEGCTIAVQRAEKKKTSALQGSCGDDCVCVGAPAARRAAWGSTLLDTTNPAHAREKIPSSSTAQAARGQTCICESPSARHRRGDPTREHAYEHRNTCSPATRGGYLGQRTSGLLLGGLLGS